MSNESTQQIELKVLSSMLNSGNAKAILYFIENRLEPFQVFFYCKDLAQIIYDYFNKYQSVVSDEILNEIILTKKNSTELSDQILEIKLITPDPAQIKYWVENLIKENQKRILKKTILNALENLNSDDVDTTIKTLETGTIESQDLSNRHLIKSVEYANNAKKRYEAYQYIEANPELNNRIPTGFKTIDDTLKGAGPGELCVVSARPGVGKSMFLLNVGYTAWEEYNKNVFFFSYEMPLEQVQRRLDARYSMLPYDKIKSGELGELEKRRYKEALKKMSQKSEKCQFRIIEMPQKTTTLVVRNEIDKIIKIHNIKPDLIILDYMLLMAPIRVTKDQKETDRIGEIALDCRELAKFYQVPVWTAAQINRSGAREKQLSTDSTYGSDQLSHHADLMFGLKKNLEEIDQFTSDNATLECQPFKTRDGFCPNFSIYFDGSMSLMVDKQQSSLL